MSTSLATSRVLAAGVAFHAATGHGRGAQEVVAVGDVVEREWVWRHAVLAQHPRDFGLDLTVYPVAAIPSASDVAGSGYPADLFRTQIALAAPVAAGGVVVNGRVGRQVVAFSVEERGEEVDEAVIAAPPMRVRFFDADGRFHLPPVRVRLHHLARRQDPAHRAGGRHRCHAPDPLLRARRRVPLLGAVARRPAPVRHRRPGGADPAVGRRRPGPRPVLAHRVRGAAVAVDRLRGGDPEPGARHPDRRHLRLLRRHHRHGDPARHRVAAGDPAHPALWLTLSAALPRDWGTIEVYFGITIILSVLGWTGLARTVRGKFLALREEASRRRPSTWAPARCASSSGTWCRRSAAT